MGDPKKIRKKYTTPKTLWDKSRISYEQKLLKEFGFKNKKEIWKARTTLDNYKGIAKMIIRTHNEQSKKEEQQLMNKLFRLGMLPESANLDDVLALRIEDVMSRRLQTVVFKKGLARTIKQSRQFIVHGHVTVNGQKITAPSYLVSLDEEQSIDISPKSSLFSPDHPERVVLTAQVAKNKATEAEE